VADGDHASFTINIPSQWWLMKWHIVTTSGYPVVHGFINGEQCMTWQLKVNSRAAAERAVDHRLDEILQENDERVDQAVGYLRQYDDMRAAKHAASIDGQIAEEDYDLWEKAIYRHLEEEREAKRETKARKKRALAWARKAALRQSSPNQP
jgi:hypothetical protein